MTEPTGPSASELTAINALTKELAKTNERLAKWLRDQSKAAGEISSSRATSLKLDQTELANAKERHELEIDRLKLLRDRADANNRANEVANLNLDIVNAELDIQDTLLSQDKERLFAANDLLKVWETQLQNLKDKRAEAVKEYKIALYKKDEDGNREASQEKIIELRKIALASDKDILTLKKEVDDLEDGGLEKLAAQLEVQKQQVKEQEKLATHAAKVHHAQDTIAKDFEDILSASLGLNKDWETTTIVGKMSLLSKGGPEAAAAMEKMKESMTKMFSKGSILVSIIQKVYQATFALAIAQSEATTELRRATGVADHYTTTLSNLHMANRAAGVSIQEAGTALISLQNEVLTFSEYSEDAQRNLATLTALMAETGVEAATTAGALQYLTAGLAMTAKQAGQTTLELMKLATDIAVPPQRLLEQLAQTGPQLAAYGDKAIAVFKDMAASAKVLKLEISDLLDFTAQFDTFEGAAEAVGKLNAIMGGNFLHSIEMVGMKEEERVREIIKMMNASGKSYDQMGKFTRRALAQAAGISDLTKANKIFGMSLSVYEDFVEKQEEGALTQKELAERAAKFQSVVDKLTNAFMSFAIALGPVIEVLGTVLTAISEILSIFTGFGSFLENTLGLTLDKGTVQFLNMAIGIASLIGLVSSLMGAWRSMVLMMMAAPFMKIVVGLMAIYYAVDYLTKKFPEFATAIKIVGFVLAILLVKWALGMAAVSTAGAPVWLVLGAIAAVVLLLIDAFTQKKSPAFYEIFGVLAIGMMTFAAAAGPAIFAMIAMIMPVGALGWGLGSLALSVAALTWSLAGLSVVLFWLEGPLTVIMKSFSEMANSVALVFHEIGGLVTAISNMDMEGVLKIGIVMHNMESIIAAIETVDIEKAVAFQGTMTSLGTSVKLAADITPDTIKNTKEFIEETSKFYEIQSEAKSADMDPLVQVLSNLLAITEGRAKADRAGSKKGPPMELVVYLDKNVVGRTAFEWHEQKMGHVAG